MYDHTKDICDRLIEATGVTQLTICLPSKGLPYLTNEPLRQAQNRAMAAILPLSGARAPIISTLVKLAEPITIQALADFILNVARCTLPGRTAAPKDWAQAKAKRRLLKVFRRFIKGFTSP